MNECIYKYTYSNLLKHYPYPYLRTHAGFFHVIV